jgi:hypothetical protein
MNAWEFLIAIVGMSLIATSLMILMPAGYWFYLFTLMAGSAAIGALVGSIVR